MSRPGSFEEFYASTHDRLVGQLFVATGALEEAQDVVQEAFARAWVRWGQLQHFAAPEAWVRRVALNLSASGFRRARRGLAARARMASTPVVAGMSSEGVELAEALRGLPVRYRQVLVLHHVVDLSVEEVARQLGVPVGTVKTRLVRGRAALARRMADSEEAAHASR
jgi:RNA polymerase sigma-70 factor (ECF subfamily)